MAITQRNKEIITDYIKGMAMIDIVAKYRVSSTRIYNILQRYDIPKKIQKPVMKEGLTDEEKKEMGIIDIS